MTGSGNQYVGFCNVGGWGTDDVVGTLLVKDDDGWYLAGQHISSNETYSLRDIGRKVPKGASFTWHGVLTEEQVLAMFPPGPEPSDG